MWREKGEGNEEMECVCVWEKAEIERERVREKENEKCMLEGEFICLAFYMRRVKEVMHLCFPKRHYISFNHNYSDTYTATCNVMLKKTGLYPHNFQWSDAAENGNCHVVHMKPCKTVITTYGRNLFDNGQKNKKIKNLGKKQSSVKTGLNEVALKPLNI